ncbi:hypothetical protein [Saccharopolyspora phatthalungensis]|uniref:Uncharacterized coiled-coil DUF342 family protein n=1 Tax=Saccharopolyspora phatthalungensis TaxID=664693 RepID=A0A840QE83_9PSEU|nr:hypothetical protein [Saccharopolyspora phatthalungensis]MBB5158281.1 uncharacterized coiled-coil DUF342 family protein [Saccharopolyspora phatthalungensis]
MSDDVADRHADTPEPTTGSAELAPPPRRGSREERREDTLRALAAGEDARCAYCGEALPPLPPRGGRPTPYCPADPQRYGQWGAKTITCAMLDEHREIWVRTYGPDQPMTHLDVHTLDQRLTALSAVLDPVRHEVAALQSHTTGELATALEARDTAETARRQAVEAARAAEAAREEAIADAESARAEADTARAEKATAAEQASQAAAERDQANAERDQAQQEAEAARTDRQHALDRVSAAHERITELQSELASERAAALERLDQLRREEDQTRQTLRTTLTQECEQRLRDQSEEIAQQLRDTHTTADQRIAELTGQLTASTRSYAASLAPLHDELSALRGDLAAQTTAATAAHRQLGGLRDALAETLAATTGNDEIRERLLAILDHSTAQKTSPEGPERGRTPQAEPVGLQRNQPKTSGDARAQPCEPYASPYSAG